ncbi:MATE family efflux transporter [Paludicola sp. MB14-C6]|uniref:MATE family efflux transporter n=1 Tax=Paludihabitans sp. MB14-C6 TaxID=3070656 RepID=UPI0027DE6D47|nr:MATE family efflux transporter [Paludicola sp. MB14-C6]WMJ22502.1 MATE family efflux transporter [Paludicola sp. MB14-C6]
MNKEQALLKGPISKTYISYLIPTIISMITNSVYCVVDVMFVGVCVGSEALAAFNIAMPIFTLFSCIGLMLGIGGATTISVLIGQGDKTNVNKVFSFSVYASILSGAIISIFSLCFPELCARLLGAPTDLVPLVVEYLRPLQIIAPLYVLNNTLQVIIRADFNPKLVMVAAISANLANIFFDWLFVSVLGYGLAGASTATAIGPCLAVFILSFHYICKKNTMHFKLKCIDKNLIKRILQNGMGSFILEFTSGAVVFMFNIVLLKVSGHSAVAVYAIVSNVAYLGKGIFNGISQAAQPLISVNYGAQNMDRMKHSLKVASITSMIFSLGLYALILIFPSQIIGMFIGDSPELLPMGIKASQLYFTSFVFTGINTVLMYYFQSAESLKITTLIALSRGFIFVVIGILIFPALIGEAGVWITITFAEIITFIIILPIKSKFDRLLRQRFNLSHEIDDAKAHEHA